MLEIQTEISSHTKSIAHSLSELVKLKKIQMGLNPFEDVPLSIIIQPQGVEDDGLVDMAIYDSQ